MDSPSIRPIGTALQTAENKLSAAEVDFARDIFADLVGAWCRRHENLPIQTETRALAETAVTMVLSFRKVQVRRPPLQIAPAPTVVQSPSKMTFATLAREWALRIERKSVGPTKGNLLRRLEHAVFPYLGHYLAADLLPDQILSVLQNIQARGRHFTAYRILQELHAFYRYAVVAGLCQKDPTVGLQGCVRRPQGRVREPLDAQSMGRLIVGIRDYRGKSRSTARYLFQLAPMIFLRPIELRGLEWREVDLPGTTIVIPGERMKGRRAHVVPLPWQAVKLLSDVQKITGGLRFVFNGGRGRDEPIHFGTFYYMFQAIGFEKRMTPHGFRAMAATWFNEQGWRPQAIERQLAHIGGGSHQARRVYDRAEHMLERRQMLQAWADYLDLLESKTRKSVVGRNTRVMELV